MVNIDKIRLGQCTITYDSVDLGFTKGGVEVTIKNDVTEVAVDEYGKSPVKSYHKGTRIEVKTTLSEFSYDAMLKVMNGATLVEGAGGDPVDALTLGDKGGRALAGKLLVLHPTLVTGTAQDVQIYKAVVIGDTKLPFKVDEETTYEVTWLALVDETKADGSLLARFGATA